MSQTSPMVFSKENNVISTSLYGSQPSSVVFACKTATFGSELQVFMGARLRLLICEWKKACLDPEWRLSVGLSLHLWFCAFKTATLASESLVSNAPSLHLWFCMQNGDFSTRISSLYSSQTSTMVLAFKTSWLAPELLFSMGPIPHPSFLQAKHRLLDQNFKSLLSPDLTYGF